MSDAFVGLLLVHLMVLVFGKHTKFFKLFVELKLLEYFITD
jgi:hypothetical protein